MSKRIKTQYPGVFYREVPRVGGNGTEKVFYVVYKKDGKVVEAKAGRQYAEDMTAKRASIFRANLIEGKEKTREQKRKDAREAKEADESRWTINRLWQEYKAQNPLRGMAQDESRYRLYLDAPFGEKEPSELVSLDIDRLRVKLLKSKSPQTVKNVLALLRRIILFGEKKALCRGLGFVIEIPGKINNTRTEDLTDEELSRLLAVLDEEQDIQAANLMRLALVTGMRRSELFRLQWYHVDFDNGFIYIKDPKGGADQIIPLNDSAKRILSDHPRTNGTDFVFPGRGGNQRVEIRKAVNRIKKAARLPDDFRPLHGLRHTFASNLASSGQVDLYTLQRLLTHKSPQMTQRYAHLRDTTMRKASNLAGELVRQAVEPAKNGLQVVK